MNCPICKKGVMLELGRPSGKETVNYQGWPKLGAPGCQAR
jgi:hypothetical protein